MIVYGLKPFNAALVGNVRDIRVLWAMEESGLSYEHKVMDAEKAEHKQPEFLKVNPFGKVPALRDNDFVMFESSAICTYVGEKAGKLVPKAGTPERALYDQWMAFSISTLEPQTVRILACDHFYPQSETTSEIRKMATGAVEGLCSTLDKIFESRAFILGTDFSMADVLVASALRFAGQDESVKKHKSVQKYLERVFERPAFKKALAAHNA